MNRLTLPRLVPRDPHEEGRTASPLELFFDLVFVVAVALASQHLHHFESDAHFSTGLVRYVMVFFAIWWAWMNFSWIASAYDSDDWLYRLLTLIQMGGALVMAAGIPRVMEDLDLKIVIVGYVIMRIALATQWFRVSQGDPLRRTTALRFAFGILLVQVFWIGVLFLPTSWIMAGWLAGAIGELLIPLYAERARSTPWHPHHVAERFSLFTLIVLGESILASSNSIIEAVEGTDHYGELILIALTGFVIVAGMWWIYFAYPQAHRLRDLKSGVMWGYGHYFIFASAAAVSAGIEVALDYSTEHTGLEAARAAATLCVPVAVFITAVWLLMARGKADRSVIVAMPVVAVLILLAVFLPYSLQIAAVLIVGLVALITVRTRGVQVHGH